MRQQLLIAGASARAAAQSAHRAGYDVLAADLFGDRDLRQVAAVRVITQYPQQIVQVAAAVPPGSWIYTGGLENHPDLVDRVSRRHQLWGNPGAVLRAVRNPWQLREVLCAAGLAAPSLATDAVAGSAERWLSKPLRGCGGRHIVRWPAGRGGSCGEGRYLQQHVDGVAYGATYLGADGDAQLMGVVRQLRGWPFLESAGFVHVGAVGPVPLHDSLQAQFTLIGTTLAQAFGLRGLFGVDVMVSGSRVWTLEVNPRYTASMEILERALGWPALAAQQAACVGQRLPPPANVRAGCWGKAVIYADRPTEVSAAFCDWVDCQNAHYASPPLLDLPQPGTDCEYGRPLLTVMAEGATAAAAERRLRLAAVQVREQLAMLRAC